MSNGLLPAGFEVGHWTDREGATGCTVILAPPEGAVASADVRGGGPGTREIDLLDPIANAQAVHAVLLTGGSAFGLAAADGVVGFLEEQGIGFDAGVARVPIVPAAVLFDLAVGDPKARPGSAAGLAACRAAGTEVGQGNVGAGTGATVAHVNGPEGAVKGGLGTASSRDGDLVVGALVAVNAFGEILDERGEVLAGSRVPAGPQAGQGHFPGTNTTIGVVATNARLSKERAHLVALAAHEGIAEAIRPAHTIFDGDTVFSLATGETEAPQSAVEDLVERTMADAIRSAIRHAESVPGVPAIGEGETA
jgi:L-aminopeptidase/D-esterase-like protein